MKNFNHFNLFKSLSPLSILLLSACSSVEVRYPEQQTNQVQPQTPASNMTVAKSAYDFKDRDIQVPANFDTQGLDSCNFSKNNEADACPLKKKAIRIYFGDNEIVSKNQEERAALQRLTNKQLGLMLENQLAGVNRFRIVTQDKVVEAEQSQQLMEQDVSKIAEVMQANSVLRPDYAVKIDTIKTAERFYAEYNGIARYDIEMTTSVIDPYTKEKLSYPNIGKIRVKGTDVRDKEFFVYTEVNNRYYTGFNYKDEENINSVFSGMASKSFDILLSRLLTEMPSSAQAQAFRNGQVTLDRGRNAGILNNETMILFNYEAGFVEPIAVAVVKPSKSSSVAQVVRWKNNELAKDIRRSSKGNIYKIPDGQKVFAVSVGLPQDYLETRM